MSSQKIHTKNADLPAFHAIIVAAGKGARFGGDIPKQYLPLNGRPMLRYSVETFQSFSQCASIRVIIDPDDAEQCQTALSGLTNVHITHGGTERKISVYNGLKGFSQVKDEDIILIHDAARPCVSHADIEKILQNLKQNRAASLAAPITSSLRTTDKEQNATETVPRENLWAIQTPQGFRYGDLLKAHENADPQKTYTDDTSLVSELGIPVKLVQGSEQNIKITHPEDRKMAEKLLSTKTITTSGIGFDVHAFDTESSGPVRLCGIDIVHPHKLKGHSDADVALHTITDAILGAIGAGDIGQHFPPSDNQFKDMDSVIFLKKALEILAEQNARLLNIDLTIICEAPKIGPHAQAMKDRLHEITALPLNRINIKATTTEGLGFTGRKEGIAAQALVSVEVTDE